MNEKTRDTATDTILLLDGGNGHELKLRGITDGSFLAGLLANEDQPAIVQSVHSDFCQSGCRILTTNSFVAVPERIRKDCMGMDAPSEAVYQRTKQLILAAVRCARQVARDSNRNNQHVQVAGTVPPLTECYMSSLVPNDADAMVPSYKFLVSTLIEAGVDILLAETLSTEREAIAIVRAMAQFNADAKKDPSTPSLAISFTIDDFRTPSTLRSGETLQLVVESVLQEANAAGIPLWGVGCNCASPKAISNAIPCLSAAIRKTGVAPHKPRIIAYSNAFQVTTSEWLASLESTQQDNGIKSSSSSSTPGNGSPLDDDDYDSSRVLLPEVYAKYAAEWQNLGASVIGGCCGCSPIHLKAVATHLGL